jgi:tetrahydromethanopterin S-methyltransferase subunit A
MTDQPTPTQPNIIGDVVFGSPDSSVAVCTLASRRLLPILAGRPEISIAGRVFTENVGIERMVQNLVALPTQRFLIVCGRESRHKVGQTILALHRAGLDAESRVVGSEAPEPLMPNLTVEQLRAFQERISLVDMIGVEDPEAIIARAAELQRLSPADAEPKAASGATPSITAVDTIVSVADPVSAWEYDPVGFFLILIDWGHRRLRAEQYDQERRLIRAFEASDAQALCHTIVREGQVSLLAHAAYLGRELAKAETALRFNIAYEQDAPLRADRPRRPPATGPITAL